MAIFARLSLLRKHALFTLVALLVTMGPFGFWSLHALQESTDQILRERLEIAEIVALHIDMHLGEVAARVGTIALSSAMDLADNDLEPEKEAFRETYRAHSDVFTYGLFLVDTSGRVLWAEPPREGVVGSSFAIDPFIGRALASPNPSFSGLTTTPGEPGAGVLVAAPIRSPAGTVSGLVLAGLDPSRATVAGLIRLLKLGKTGYAQVVDHSGFLVASSRPESLAQDTDHGPRFTKLIESGQKTVATCHRCHETEQGPERRRDVLAFAPLSVAPWGVAVRQSEEEAFALISDLQGKMVGLGVISFLVLGYLAWTITRSIVRPITRLTHASQRIASGDFGGTIPWVGSDEIGLLAESLEAMRGRLNASREEMEQQNVELQRKTEELQRKTTELSALFDASKALTSTLDVETIFSAIVHKTKDIVGPADGAALLLWDSRSERLVPRASLGFDFGTLSQVRLKAGEAAAGKVFQSGEPLMLADEEVPVSREDMSPDNHRLFSRSRLGPEQARQVICVPLIAKDVTTGALIAYNFDSPGSFSRSDVQALQALADQAAVAVENARLYEEVQQKEEQRRQLLDKVILAQEEERKRVARELHDEIGQALTALVMGLGSAEESLPPELVELKTRLAGIRDLTADTLREIRRLMLDLRPTLLDDLGLIPALSWYVDSHLARARIEMRFETDGFKRRLPSHLETVLFRVIQEAITNIAKHSGATSARIRLELKDSAVSAVVEDDGRGFDVALARQGGDKGLGLGLLGMEERVTLLGGAFRVESEPGRGTRLGLRIPLPGQKENQ